MPGIARKPSTAGMIESCVFGFPLAERTPYTNIAVLRECQKLTVSAGGDIRLTNYHDWSIAGLVPSEPAVAAQALFAEFQEGIGLRLATDRRVYAFLSGGMDSRAIVSSLASMGCEIEALNFSPDLSQDQVYARQFAETLHAQCRLSFLPRDENPNFSMLAFNAKSKLEQEVAVNVDRPTFLWSGDGGSVGLGHVYMDEDMLNFAERGDLQAALDHFLSFNGLSLPAKVLAKESRASLQQMLSANALSEINRYARADAGRRLYLFLLFNDQRRHLFKHFESIDQHGLEFLLPFYDAHFLKRVVDTPARWGVLHKLYALWFDHLDPAARSTPWQTYPGHQPCPVKGDDSLSYQWAGRNGDAELTLSERLRGGRYLAKQALGPSLPGIFSRPWLLLAAVLHGSGLRDCGHILTMLGTYRQLGAHAN
ncbi:MAG: asparagine synthase-related protein [Gammaproteobacteria bacterium]|nr:asparagine synthase-related protein [Gammaproteobacteria bacterium]